MAQDTKVARWGKTLKVGDIVRSRLNSHFIYKVVKVYNKDNVRVKVVGGNITYKTDTFICKKMSSIDVLAFKLLGKFND